MLRALRVRPAPGLLLAALLLMGTPAGAAAQRTSEPPVPVEPDLRPQAQDVPPVSPVFLASAVIPGAAQWLMGDDRWVPYLATELWAVVSYMQQRRSARELEQRYRDLAWQVARRPDRPDVRRDTVFEYYETMAHYPSSGSHMPGGAPETQPGTFNGEIWKLARALYFPGGEAAAPGTPAYEQAVAYYQSRAIPPGYGWAWGASNLEQQVFADLITESDAAFRSATRYIGLLLANHITSAVDALVTARLRQLAGQGVRIESTPHRDGNDFRMEYGVRLRF
ncbi:hypothetical protein BH23GEM9_BH23GEM9_05030 [soil metagenome]